MTGLLIPVLAFILVAGALGVWAAYRLARATDGKVEPPRSKSDGSPWGPPG